MIQTEFEFTLPVGYQDEDGTLHRNGTMRMATAADEIHPLKDPRVQANAAYLICILLARVVRLDGVEQMNPAVVERLYAADLAYLQDFYNRINRTGTPSVPATCPRCAHAFEVEVERSGELVATP